MRLTNDLLDCPELGLVVGAPRITIDLGGFTVDGVGLGVGVRNRGFDDVTVTNGTVSSFDVGVQLETGTRGNILQSLDLTQNQEAGAALLDADDGTVGNTLRDNDVAGNALGIILAKGTRGTLVHDNDVGANSGDGVRIDHSIQNVVEDNHIVGSSGGGVTLVGAADNQVRNNELAGNGIIVESGYPEQVIAVVPSEPPVLPEPADTPRPSPNNIVEGNTLEDDGIEVNESNGNQVIGNAIHEAASGIDLYNAHNGLLRQNDVTLNSSGIELIGSRNNRIEGNNASETSGTGISVKSLSLRQRARRQHGQRQQRRHLRWRRRARRHGQRDRAKHRQQQRRRRHPGLVPRSHGHRQHRQPQRQLGDLRGHGLGAQGTIDGGGNSASDNTQPAQCFGVRCDGEEAPRELVPPDTIILRGPADPSSSSTATVRFTGTDNVSLVTFECSLDAGAFAPCTSPAELTGVTVGAHTFRVRAIDAAGNADATPAEHSWARDGTAAAVQTTIDVAPAAVTVATDATFTFSATEPGLAFTCSLDGAPASPCTSPAAYTGLGASAHTFDGRRCRRSVASQPQLDDRRRAGRHRGRLR